MWFLSHKEPELMTHVCDFIHYNVQYVMFIVANTTLIMWQYLMSMRPNVQDSDQLILIDRGL
jgi:hypothetical protein